MNLREVTAFLIHEARLLDTRAFGEWLDLFAPDGLYWVPSQPGQTDRLGVASIIYEDRAILAMRVQRLLEARALVMTPMPRTVHLLGNVTVTPTEPGADATAAVMVTQYHGGRSTITAGYGTWQLRRVDDSWLIVLKRFDMLDCDGRHGPITVPL